MKIPQIVADASIGEPPAPQPNAEAWGAPFTALSRAGQHLGHVSAEIAAINGRIKQEQDRDKATDLFSSVGSKVESLRESARQPQSRENPYGFPEGEPPSKTYVERFTVGYDALVKDTMGQNADPGVQHYLNRRLLHLKAEALTHVQKDQWGLFKDEQAAGIPARLETFRSQIIANPATRETTMQAANGYLDSLVGSQGPKAIEQMRHKFGQDVHYGLARREIDADPFNANVSKYETGLTPENALKLHEYQALAQKKQLGVEDRAQRKLQQEIDSQRTATFANLTDRALQGRLTEDELRSDPGFKWLHGSDIEHVTGMIRTPKVAPSDAQTRQQVISRAYLIRPQMTEGEIVALNKRLGPNGAPLLNDADTINALTWVRERNDYWRGQGRADSHRAEDQTRHREEREQTYLDHTMEGALSLTGSIAERLDPKAQEIKAIARDTMFRRSRTYRGKEDPEAVMHDILPDLMTRLADGPDGVKDDYGKMQRIIELGPYKTKQDLLNAKGKIPDGEFYRWAESFKNLDDAKRTYEGLQDAIKRRREDAQRKAKK